MVTNGNHCSTSGLTSAGSSTSSVETAVITRTVAVEPAKNKKNKRSSAHLGSDKYLKSCTMDFQYIEVSGNGSGNAQPIVNNTANHVDVTDTTTGNLLVVTEEENISMTSSSDDSSSHPITLATALENVMIALEEPRGVCAVVFYTMYNCSIVMGANGMNHFKTKFLFC